MVAEPNKPTGGEEAASGGGEGVETIEASGDAIVIGGALDNIADAFRQLAGSISEHAKATKALAEAAGGDGEEAPPGRTEL